jgi:Ca2+-transporting ATPase
MTEKSALQPIEHPHVLSIEEVLQSSHTDPDQGLTPEEAIKRRQIHGKNIIESGEKVSALKILFDNVNNIIVYLLIAASAVAFFMGDPVEGFAVIVAIVIAVVSGFVSEYKAQKSVEALQNMVKSISKVRRQGDILEIPSEDIVLGDLLFIEEGDAIGADARIVKSKNFATAESALTGEAEAIEKDHEFIGEKDTTLGDRMNMVFTGTAATRGNAYAVVTSIGMQTEIGKISALLKEDHKTATPLEEQLDRLGKTLILFAGLVALAVTVVGLLSGEDMYTMIKIGIILAIAAVPEALPAVSTITLAIGMKTMASHNALVKSLPAVETLGSTTVICTDKTGTLTENQMTVKSIFLQNGEIHEVGSAEDAGEETQDQAAKSQPEKQQDQENVALKALIVAGVLSSNASLAEENGMIKVIGDPTEGGLLNLGKNAGIDKKTLSDQGYERFGEIPFNSKVKFMATAYKTASEGNKLYVKGAPDVLFEMLKDNEDREAFLQANEKYAQLGMRVLAIGEISDYQGDDTEASMKTAIDQGIELLGLTGIIDPPREDVKQAIHDAQEAGIRIIMITGDHPKTASIIAEKIGIANSEKVITGKEMDQMSDETLAEEIQSTAIFARVSPENKLQIVRALNIDNEVTAMTGDGVNDAPALKGADIGIAMGIRGTEVAKEAADMILTDDRFSTIVDAVREGRIIFDNIRKFVYFLFSCNVVEILAVFLTIVLRLPMPVLALQILWLNLVVDVLPAMSLAWEPGEADIMQRKPRNPEQAIINRPFLIKILINGALIGLGALAVFVYGLNAGYSEETARTMSFSTMAFGQLMHLFNVSEKSVFDLKRSIFQNRYMLGALLISLLLQLTAVYLPFFNTVMGTTPLSAYKWFVIFLGAFLPTLLIQITRKIFSERSIL